MYFNWMHYFYKLKRFFNQISLITTICRFFLKMIRFFCWLCDIWSILNSAHLGKEFEIFFLQSICSAHCTPTLRVSIIRIYYWISKWEILMVFFSFRTHQRRWRKIDWKKISMSNFHSPFWIYIFTLTGTKLFNPKRIYFTQHDSSVFKIQLINLVADVKFFETERTVNPNNNNNNNKISERWIFHFGRVFNVVVYERSCFCYFVLFLLFGD